MNYNEFAVKIKEKYPEYTDMDNRELAQKMVQKYPQEYSDITFDETPMQTEKQNNGNPIGNFVQGAAYGLTAPFTEIARQGANVIRPLIGKEKVSREELNEVPLYKYTNKKPDTVSGNIGAFAGSIAPALALPEVKLAQAPQAANLALTGAYQGGLLGAGESLKEKGDLSGIGSGALIGGAINPAIPYAGKAIKETVKLLPKAGGGIAKTLGRLQPETLQRAVQPDSKALDLTPEQAQNLLMNTTERVRNDYKSLLNQKGDTVGNLLKELPENASIKADDLSNLYDSIYNNYSLSGNQELNPALNVTSREIDKIKNMLYGDEQQRMKDYAQTLKDLEFDKGYLDVIRNRYKNTYHTKVLDNLNNGIVNAQRKFNADILGKLRKNPEILQDAEELAKLEKEVSKIASFPYEEVNQDFYNKFYQAIGGATDKTQITRNPKELYDINKNISNMINWDIPGTQTKNDVLEQLYLANAKKISDLSPALKQANKEYADLMDFQKNEGIRRILNNSNNIDTASSALKNYNNTVTKGNTNRNIQDLEKILTDNNYQPFLKDIDDVNAAMDLNNIRTTGDSFWANLGTAMARPLLRAARSYNASPLPKKTAKQLRKLREAQKTYLPEAPVAVELSSPLLYGGITYNEGY